MLPANIHQTEQPFAVLRDFTDGTAARELGQRLCTCLEILCLSVVCAALTGHERGV